ncbi:MAG: CarD family transcriptional regulator [Candidatus Dependentiae bacterium]|nr:CarD family transcriptional regulator [Candidatus Dependentiae bacterium]
MRFKVNERVVYPAHGVAVIEDVIEKHVGGAPMQFYKLSFLYKDMTVLIPVNNTGQTGVRTLNMPQSIDEALTAYSAAVLQQRFEDLEVSPTVWSKRQKDYQTRLQAGDFVGILAIYQELMYIGQHKELSFGEKSLQQATEELLAQEIMVVKDLDRSAALELVRAPFKQFIVSYASSGQHGSTNSLI